VARICGGGTKLKQNETAFQQVSKKFLTIDWVPDNDYASSAKAFRAEVIAVCHKSAIGEGVDATLSARPHGRR
jgi:hypothetical protein